MGGAGLRCDGRASDRGQNQQAKAANSFHTKDVSLLVSYHDQDLQSLAEQAALGSVK